MQAGSSFSEEERGFLESHRTAHLATADARGTPHVVPVCYALIADCLYFIVDDKPKPTRHGLKRLRNLRENPRVANGSEGPVHTYSAGGCQPFSRQSSQTGTAVRQPSFVTTTP